jgi:hypothetical protein
MFELGAKVRDTNGKRLAPVNVLLETDSRNPSAKHQLLEMYVAHRLARPNTPTRGPSQRCPRFRSGFQDS